MNNGGMWKPGAEVYQRRQTEDLASKLDTEDIQNELLAAALKTGDKGLIHKARAIVAEAKIKMIQKRKRR